MNDSNLSAIDKAIAQAQARKAAKASGEPAAPKAPKEPKAPKAVAEPKVPRVSEEEKAARLAARETARTAAKTVRDAARAEKLAAKNATKPQAHLKKVERAAEKLGILNEAATLLFNEATANLAAADVATLAAHLNHFNRVKSTERASATRVEAGASVTIVGGDPRYIGRTGMVFKAQRIRCYVTVEGLSKPVYCFTSDVTVNTETEVAATGTEG